MKKLTTYLLSTGMILAAAAAMSAVAYAEGEDSGSSGGTTTVTPTAAQEASGELKPVQINKSVEKATYTDGEGDSAKEKEIAVKGYDSVEAAFAAITKAKGTDAYVLTIDGTVEGAASLGDKGVTPKTAKSITLANKAESGVLNVEAAAAVAANCDLILNNVSIVGNGSTKFTAKGNVTLTGDSQIKDLGSLKGAKDKTLTFAADQVFNYDLSGFGTVKVPAGVTADLIGGAKKGPTFVALDLAGTVNVYDKLVTVDTLSGNGTIKYITSITKDSAESDDATTAKHSYVSVKKSLKASGITLDNAEVTTIGENGTPTSVQKEFDTDQVLLLKAKDYDSKKNSTYFKIADAIAVVGGAATTTEPTQGEVDPSEQGSGYIAPTLVGDDGTTDTETTADAVNYGLSVIKGVARVKAEAFEYGGKKYTEWTDVAAQIKGKAVIELLADTDVGGAIKFPKKGTYDSITINGNNHTLAFTGGLSAESLILNDITLKSYKLDKKSGAKNGVAFALAGKTALTLDGVLLDEGEYTLGEDDSKEYTEQPTTLKSISAGALTLGSGELDVLGKVAASSLDLTGNFLLGTPALTVKGAVTGEENSLTLHILDKKGDPGDTSKAKIGVGTYGNQFKIETFGKATEDAATETWHEGESKLVFSGKNLVIVSSETATTMVKAGDALIEFKTAKDAASYIDNAAKSKDTKAAAAAKKTDYTIAYADETIEKLTLPKAGNFKTLTLASTINVAATETEDAKIGSTLDASKVKKIAYNIILDKSISVSGSLDAKSTGKFTGGTIIHQYAASLDEKTGKKVTLTDNGTAFTKLTDWAVVDSAGAALEGVTINAGTLAATATADVSGFITVKNTEDDSSAKIALTVKYTAPAEDAAEGTAGTYEFELGDVTTINNDPVAWDSAAQTSGGNGGGGASQSVTLAITVTEDGALTVKKNGTEVTEGVTWTGAVLDDGVYYVEATEAGDTTVSATVDGTTKTVTITVTVTGSGRSAVTTYALKS